MILLQNIKVCGNLFRFLLPLVFVFTFVATRRLKNTNSVSRNAPNNTESTDVTSALKCRYNTTTTTSSSDQHSVCLWNLISARFTSHAHSWMNGESSFMNGKPALAINAVNNCSWKRAITFGKQWSTFLYIAEPNRRPYKCKQTPTHVNK